METTGNLQSTLGQSVTLMMNLKRCKKLKMKKEILWHKERLNKHDLLVYQYCIEFINFMGLTTVTIVFLMLCTAVALSIVN